MRKDKSFSYMRSCLTDFQYLRPPHEKEQQEALEWIAQAHTRAESLLRKWPEEAPERRSFYEHLKERLMALGIGPHKIQKRGFYLEDLSHQNWEEMEIYQLGVSPYGKGLKNRILFYEKIIDQVFERFYPPEKLFPDHLIHVTCTGYVSPSGAQKLLARRAIAKTVVTHAYHMGCYGALPAIRMGEGFLCSAAAPAKKADIIHTELCSLHMDPCCHDMDQLVVQSLFADGLVKYSMLDLEGVESSALEVLSLHEETLPQSTPFMSWKCEDWGFRMKLMKEVPVYFRRHFERFLQTLAEKAFVSVKEIREQALFAIHPGGPKVIEQIRDLLLLEEEQILHSHQILKEYGNMSSATLPHIWQRILEDGDVSKGTPVLSVAFGPGLSISGAVLKKR